MFETTLILPAGNATRYDIHRQLAARLQSEGPRDYVYAVLPDAAGDVVYLRSPVVRPEVADWARDWTAVAYPEAGRTYQVFGILYFDRSRSRCRGHRPVPDRIRKEAWSADYLTARITALLSPCGTVSEVNHRRCDAETTGKPGMEGIIITPIGAWATVTITEAERAAELMRRGVGRGRGFGFGTLHFIPKNGVNTDE